MRNCNAFGPLFLILFLYISVDEAKIFIYLQNKFAKPCLYTASSCCRYLYVFPDGSKSLFDRHVW